MSFTPCITSVIDKKIPVPDSEATITIKHIKPGIMQGIIQSTMNVVSKQQGDSEKMASEISFSMYSKNKAVVQECMTHWTGFKNEGGKNMKFNAINLLKMIAESDDFVDFVIKEHDKLDEEVAAEAGEAEKN